MAETIHTPEQAGRREWVGLCVLSIACVISVLFRHCHAMAAPDRPKPGTELHRDARVR